MPLPTTKTCLIAALAIGLFPTAAAPVFAADMIEYGDPQYMPVARKHRTYTVKTTYVAPVNCDELLIEYRPPYEPHTEIVRFCDRYRY